jgi:hypothetical protein
MGGIDETSPPHVLAFGSGRCRAPGYVAHRTGTTYPTRPVRRNAVAPDAKQQFAFSFIETIASIRD